MATVEDDDDDVVLGHVWRRRAGVQPWLYQKRGGFPWWLSPAPTPPIPLPGAAEKACKYVKKGQNRKSVAVC